jgi:hypothetical protein
MRKIKLAAAVLAAITGLLAAPGAAGAATVRPDSGVYTSSSITREFYNAYHECGTQGLCRQGGSVHFQLHTTYTASQIWINGSVACSSGGDVTSDVTWCGVGGGNGTADLNVGMNWNVPSWSASGLYERMDVYADDYGCDTYGTNSQVGGIASWANGTLTCES